MKAGNTTFKDTIIVLVEIFHSEAVTFYAQNLKKHIVKYFSFLCHESNTWMHQQWSVMWIQVCVMEDEDTFKAGGRIQTNV